MQSFYLKNKKTLTFIFELTLLAFLILIFTNLPAFAKEILPISDKAKQIFGEGNIQMPPDGDTGQNTMVKLVLGGLGYVKTLTVVIGILYFTLLGYVLVSEGHNEEEVTKAKKGMIFMLIAFMGISMAEDLGKIFDMENATLLENPQEILKRVHLFDKQVEIFITFVKYAMGAYATLMVVQSGVKLVTAGGNEEESGKHKKSIMYSAGGLLLIYVGDIFINKVFYKVDKTIYSGISGVHPKVDAKEGVDQLIGITNFIVSFVGPLAVLMLIGGAIMYATAGGNDENLQKAKRIIITSAIGILIIYGAFAIVSTVLAGRLDTLGTLID